jgi:hypothetical protein
MKRYQVPESHHILPEHRIAHVLPIPVKMGCSSVLPDLIEAIKAKKIWSYYAHKRE